MLGRMLGQAGARVRLASSRARFSVPRLAAAGVGLAATAVPFAAAACESASAEAASPAVSMAASPTEDRKLPRVLCLHGINLNMFGKRDPETYGTETLEHIDGSLAALASELGVEIECFQTNHEGAMVERIHRAHSDGSAAVLVNSGAWTHYSYGIRDALAILQIPIIEVHMSNIHAREDMRGSHQELIRHHSVVSPLAKGVIAGFGITSYLLGLRAAAQVLGATEKVGRWYTDGPQTGKKKGSQAPF